MSDRDSTNVRGAAYLAGLDILREDEWDPGDAISQRELDWSERVLRRAEANMGPSASREEVDAEVQRLIKAWARKAVGGGRDPSQTPG